MSLNRYAKRRDGNEKEIVDALRKIGAVVVQQDRPCDLWIGWSGQWVAMEVKRPDGRIRAAQWKFITDCQAKGLRAGFVRTVDDALELIGARH